MENWERVRDKRFEDKYFIEIEGALIDVSKIEVIRTSVTEDIYTDYIEFVLDIQVNGVSNKFKYEHKKKELFEKMSRKVRSEVLTANGYQRKSDD